MKTMSNHGIEVNNRHIELLADNMTLTGLVLGNTRQGLERMKESVFSLASFERTGEHLHDGAYYGKKDVINGVSDSIICGKGIRIGTGAFKLLHKPTAMPVFKPVRVHYDLYDD